MKKVMTAICSIIIAIIAFLAVGTVLSGKTKTEKIEVFADCPTVKIVHVGDTHFPTCSMSEQELAALINAQSPSLAVFTGDIADASATKEDIARLSALFLSVSCPKFLTIGNHEIGSENLDYFIAIAKNAGVKVLINEICTVEINGAKIGVIGLSDGYPYKESTLQGETSAKIKILLSHRPEKLDEYASAPEKIRPDVVFAGHAHGGLARIGSLALYAPNQGLFPKYTSGVYIKNSTTMIVTRGLGVSGVDFRVFNPYHLPVVTLGNSQP